MSRRFQKGNITENLVFFTREIFHNVNNKPITLFEGYQCRGPTHMARCKFYYNALNDQSTLWMVGGNIEFVNYENLTINLHTCYHILQFWEADYEYLYVTDITECTGETLGLY
jgi:hypothetical protein